MQAVFDSLVELIEQEIAVSNGATRYVSFYSARGTSHPRSLRVQVRSTGRPEPSEAVILAPEVRRWLEARSLRSEAGKTLSRHQILEIGKDLQDVLENEFGELCVHVVPGKGVSTAMGKRFEIHLTKVLTKRA